MTIELDPAQAARLYRETELTSPPVSRETGGDGTRTVTVRLCRWNAPRAVVDPDGSRYREQYPPGSLELAPHVHVTDAHTGTLIGRADPDTLTDDGDGPTVELTISPTAAGRDLLAHLASGVIRAVSMELEPVTVERAGDLLTRVRSMVHGVAFAFRPQLDTAVLNIRGDPPTNHPEGEPPMSDTALLRDTAPPAVAPAPIVATVDADTLDRAIEDLRREVLTRDVPVSAGHPALKFRSLEAWAEESWKSPETAGLLSRALADQITANNPGVVPPAWVTEVFGVVDAGRPTITAIGTKPLPPSGMEVDWPYFAGDLKTLVGEQLTQKSAITSVRVDLLRASVPLRTFAGGSDLSYQLIRRSSPSYRDAYLRIMMAAYAAVTDMAAATAAVAAAGTPLALDAAGDTTGSALAGVLFEGSAAVEAATGSPASFALASTDVFIGYGGALNPQYGLQGQATANASTLTVNVSGLTLTHDPYLAAGTILEGNRSAASWWEDGPFAVTAEDVEKLGQNVAVWGMGNFGAPVPAGLVHITVTGAVIPLAASSKSTK